MASINVLSADTVVSDPPGQNYNSERGWTPGMAITYRYSTQMLSLVRFAVYARPQFRLACLPEIPK